jgi:hypothetical protein
VIKGAKMKIISKFRDYYDNVSHQYLDKEILFLRKNKIEQVSKAELKKLPRISYFEVSHVGVNYRLYLEIICFCGVSIPVITVREVNPKNNIKSCFYDLGQLEDYFAEWGYPLQFHKTDWRNYSYEHMMKEFKLFFSNREYFASLENYYRHWNSPYFIFRCNFYSKNNSEFEINPLLKDYNFAKLRDPFTAHQEIYMFVSSMLKQPVRPMVEISDKDKIHKYGFDKFSFRKLPSKK